LPTQNWVQSAAILLALGVLAGMAGLIRAETARDLHTLTAARAGSDTRRTITAVTVGALGLLGAVGGTALAYLAVTAWAHGSLGSTLGPVPAADLIAILAGLPLAAAAGGWLLSGRQPPSSPGSRSNEPPLTTSLRRQLGRDLRTVIAKGSTSRSASARARARSAA
jgi:hypothetical protein